MHRKKPGTAAGVEPAPPRIPANWSHAAARRQLAVLPFLGYANDEFAVLRGRVLRARKPSVAQPDVRSWRNFVALARLANSAEVPNATVLTHLFSHQYTAVTDSEGYFEFKLPLERPLDRNTEVELQLAAPRSVGAVTSARATILAPPATARFGIISDIDDTVVWTYVTDRRRMIWMLARSNAATRKPLAGVAALYRALRDGASGGEGNPIFYVSSGPWNLYPALLEFLQINDIPTGPLFLKDWGRHMFVSWRDHGTHKMAAIREVMTAYARMPFVLVGDSGEQDPEIYREAVREFPGRVAAIYIRSIADSPTRRAAIERLAAEVRAAGSALHLVTDSHTAALHEAHAGRIAQQRLAAIAADQHVNHHLPRASTV